MTDATYEKLVRRLSLKSSPDSRDAAAALEALTAERDDYAQKLMKANDTYTEMHLKIEALTAELAEARAEVERLTGALERLMGAVNAMPGGSWMWQTNVPNAIAHARAALKGDDT